MNSKLPYYLLIAALLPQLFYACKPSKTTPSPKSSEHSSLQREYLQLQKSHHLAQSRLIQLQQENEAFKADRSSLDSRDQDVAKLLGHTQKKLTSLQREYQIIQADYTRLEQSIAPLAARLQASIKAHRKELTGSKLGTIILKNGRALSQVEVTEISDQTLKLKFAQGWINVPYADLPDDIQTRFFFESLLISPSSLLQKGPSPGNANDPPPRDRKLKKPTIQEMFAERNRQQFSQYKRSIQPKIDLLKKQITTTEQKIAKLKQERTKTYRHFSKTSGSIKRSTIDRDKAINHIDSKIRNLSIAIEVAKAQIKGWINELSKSE